MIESIKMINYRNFKEKTIPFNKGRNIFVGENGVGKSSILLAISYVLNGSFSQIEKIGFESLFNVHAIQSFLKGDKKIEELPNLVVELYFEEEFDPSNFEIHGKQNTDKKEKFGLQLKISPNESFLEEIKTVLELGDVFPFEYYKLEFNTFAGVPYSSYNKKIKAKYEFIDSSAINSNYAMKQYVFRLFSNGADKQTQQKIKLEFRNETDKFSDKLYSEYGLKKAADDYLIRMSSFGEGSFENKITAQKNQIDITDYGQGEKVMVSVKASIVASKEDVNVVLIEEPENHLSYINMHRLISLIEGTNDKQTFIATHSNMIASRLDLSNIILMSESDVMKLNQLPTDTAKFFQKAPDNNILNFLLANKAILVEGDAEYILVEAFFKQILNKDPYEQGVSIISCDGKTFKRYLQIAKLLNKKVAVITDNDEDYERNIIESYAAYGLENMIHIYSDKDNENRTFEVSLYNNNIAFYDGNFKTSQMTNGMLRYMLDNKAEAAFRLLEYIEKHSTTFNNNYTIPEYVSGAIKWIDKKD